MKDRIILGIDPGTNVMGFGLIHIKGNKNPELIQLGVLHLKKYATHEMKLKKIFEKVTHLIDDYLPDELAIEAPFFGKNVQSMLKLGRAQGVAMAAALQRNIPLTEYAPKKVKQSVTGNGNASKEQVAAMLFQIFKMKDGDFLHDATDALAVALCHHYQDKIPSISKGAKGWEGFIAKNQHRIVKKN